MELARGPAKPDPGDCYCYLPLYVFCGRHLLAAKLRRSNIDASAGSVEEVARIVDRIRARWPRVKILLLADSGFAREGLMAWCEAGRVDYLFGLARNERLEERIAGALIRAETESAATGKPNKSEIHSVGIGELLCSPMTPCCKRVIADSEPRCTYLR